MDKPTCASLLSLTFRSQATGVPRRTPRQRQHLRGDVTKATPTAWWQPRTCWWRQARNATAQIGAWCLKWATWNT